MDEQVKKTDGAAEYRRLKKVAQGLGIDTTGMKMVDLNKAIDANGTVLPETVQPATEVGRLTGEAVKLGIDVTDMDKDEIVAAIQRKQIADRLRIETEEREKLHHEYRMKADRAEILAESESLAIAITLPENCTELDLAKARQKLGIEKKTPKPSIETLAIEASKKGYYIFRNLEQQDMDGVFFPGDKYRFEVIHDELHVLPEWLVQEYIPQQAIFPVYGRVPRADGKGEDTARTGSRPRWSFDYRGPAPQESEFGVVRDESLREKLLPKTMAVM